jgi:toxin ParE1/3/4
MRLDWSALAISDRNGIFDYIEADSPAAAAMVDDRIRLAIDGLAGFPEMGRAGRVRETRELVIPRTPYIVVYRIRGKSLTILRILHGSQQWPKEGPSNK